MSFRNRYDEALDRVAVLSCRRQFQATPPIEGITAGTMGVGCDGEARSQEPPLWFIVGAVANARALPTVFGAGFYSLMDGALEEDP